MKNDRLSWMISIILYSSLSTEVFASDRRFEGAMNIGAVININGDFLSGVALDMGFYISPQLYVGGQWRSSLLSYTLALQSKYYENESPNSAFVSGSIGTYSDISWLGGEVESEAIMSLGVGYAWEYLEVELTATDMVSSADKDVVILSTVRLCF